MINYKSTFFPLKFVVINNLYLTSLDKLLAVLTTICSNLTH